MRIAMVTPWFPTQVNPASGAFVVKDSVAIAKAGHDVRIIHLVPSHEDDGLSAIVHEGLPVVRVPMDTNNPLSIMRASRRVAELVRHADVLHTQAISAIEPFVLSRPKIPWVHTEHWSAITSPNTLPAMARWALPFLLRMELLPDVVVAVCEFLASPLREVRGERRIEIIPCQVPPPQMLSARPARGERLRLISTGALVPRKDPLLAIDTLDALRRLGHEAELVWLGDGPLRHEAIAKAESLGVTASFPGTKSAADVRAELAAADMFFGPTRADNFFVAAAEAIVNGRPLVVGSNGGQGEYIDDSVGQTVDDQNAEAYAKAILEVDERTASLSAEDIAATVGIRFSGETVAAEYCRLYDDLVGL